MPAAGNVLGYMVLLSWLFVKILFHIFLVEGDKHNDARCHDGENHHEVDTGSSGEQQPAQSHPQEQDAHEAYHIACIHNYIKN